MFFLTIFLTVCILIIHPNQFLVSIKLKVIYNSNSLLFILFLSHHGTDSDISGTMTVTVPGFRQRPDNRNVIPTTSHSHSHLTETVLGKYIPNTSALPNDHVYNDIILRLNSYPIFHFYCKTFILVI